MDSIVLFSIFIKIYGYIGNNVCKNTNNYGKTLYFVCINEYECFINEYLMWRNGNDICLISNINWIN